MRRLASPGLFSSSSSCRKPKANPLNKSKEIWWIESLYVDSYSRAHQAPNRNDCRGQQSAALGCPSRYENAGFVTREQDKGQSRRLDRRHSDSDVFARSTG